MVCQNCAHVYAISSGIPNMVRTLFHPPTSHLLIALSQLLNEDEVA
jgi:uncharacterized protein YbaR (Trm112 family)